MRSLEAPTLGGRSTGVAVLAVFIASTACAPADTPSETAPASANAAPPETSRATASEPMRAPASILVETPSPAPVPALPAPVIAMRDELLDAADDRALRRLGRIASAQEAFLSNLGNDDHYNHWYLMRATGFDVLRELEDLFEHPYGTKQVGQETWYIWPDLAALESDALLPERLSFKDRARLKALIGETGIDAMRAGAPYPGIRTAIAEDGGWRYFLHETALEEDKTDG